MESQNWPWWRRHGVVVLLLGVAFAIAFFVRTLWMVPLLQQYGSLNLFGGGSDSFYHYRVSEYIVQNHVNLIHDPLLKYPLGAINPREPLFDWMNAILAIIFAPLFGGNTAGAVAFFLELDGPLWAALGVFPVYLIGREISDKRVGIVAALLYAIAVANIDSSTFGYANYLSFYTFFILITFYCYLRTIRAAGTRKWVVKYSRPQEIPGALRAFARTERSAIKWSVFTGVSFGALALAWQGYTYIVAIVVIFMIFALLVERIRKVDSFGLYVCTWIVGLVGFPMAMPYFWVQGLLLTWFGLPLLVFVGGLVLCVPLIVLRDQPWIVSIPAFLGVALAGIGAMAVVDNSEFVNIVTGEGYFVKTLIYSTVAEAQAPSIDSLIIGYGVITFFVAFIGLGLWFYRMIRGRFPRIMMVAVVFAIVSIYLPLSAAKFFFLGSAAFALLPAEALIRAVDVAEFPKLRRTVAQLSDRRSQMAAFRRAFKPRHVLIPVLVIGLILPNVWYAIDAGIPYNNKDTFNQQVYNSLPSFLQTAPANSSTFYLGAAGTELDTPPQYDEAGYNWLSGQDQNQTPADRPAFVSWWDYGFQAIAEGLHPSVADNFQNGIDPSGNFLLSQNESLAIGVLTATLLSAEQQTSGDRYLPAALNKILARDGVDLPALHNLLANESYDVQLVLAHPERYLPVDPSHIDGDNAMYDTVSWELADTLSLNGMAQVYDDVQQYTHWTIRYAMVDDRLFPFSGQDTGIFYAPADLTDRVISAGGIPTTYFNVNITGSDGNTYPYGQLPSGVSATGYPITYYAPFYNSMLYHIFVGYNGTDVGQGAGIPGVTLSGASPMPGWMLQHFQLVYRTAYYCPFPTTTGHPNCASAINLPMAEHLAKIQNGSYDDSVQTYANSGGEMILAYYPGQVLTGTVELASGAPVEGARITVYDSFGIPHMTMVTGSDGAYSVILPPGNDTVNVTTGSFNALTQADTTVLASLNEPIAPEQGYSLDPTPMVLPIMLKPATVTGVVYWNVANNGTYQPSVDPVAAGDAVTLWGAAGSKTVPTDASGTYRFTNLAPGAYNLSVENRGYNISNSSLGAVYAQPGQVTNRSVGLSPAAVKGQVLLPGGKPAVGASVWVSDASGTIANTTTDDLGNYSFASLPPGNLSLVASLGSQNLRTDPVALPSLSGGAAVEENVTLVPYGTVSLTVLSDGNPVAGFPVRFTPILPFALPSSAAQSAPSPNGTGVGPGPGPNGTGNFTGNQSQVHPNQANTNATVLLTGPGGTLNGQLPAGNYSVYGLGLDGSTWSAGLATTEVRVGVQTLPPLQVGPALRLSGNLQLQAAASGAVVELEAYASNGAAAWTFTNGSGDWGLSLPAGAYSLLAVQTPSSGHPSAFAQVGRVDLTADTTLPLATEPAALFDPVVGAAAGAGGAITPLPGATVTVSLPSLGISLQSLTNGTGNATFYLPISVAGGATYCVNVTDLGYAAYSRCDIAGGTITTLRSISLSPSGVPVTFELRGLPSGSTATLNVTAQTSTAKTVTLSGGSRLATTLTPGAYQITAWAPAPSGQLGLYELGVSTNLTVPVGGSAFSVPLTLLHEVPSRGLLRLAPGIVASNVTISLSSVEYATSVNGLHYQSHFLLPPGRYTALANAQGESGSFGALAAITFNATGNTTQILAVTDNATTVTFNATVAGGSLANTSFPATLVSSGGLDVSIRFTDGRYVGGLPSGLRFNVSVDATALVLSTTTGVTQYELLRTSPASAPCFTGSSAATVCPVLLVPSLVASSLVGTLEIPGFPGSLPGTLEIAGPGLSNATAVSVPASGFNLSLAPGTYTLYAHSVDGSAAYANLSQVTVGPTATGPISVELGPAWTDALTVLAPPSATATSASVTVTNPTGLLWTVASVPLGVTSPVVLPSGGYTISAHISGAPYGVAANASASSSVALYRGNAATTLALAWQFHRTVRFSVPASSFQLGNGGTARFAFSVTNTGNVPFAVTFVGSPSTYNITFVPSNATLGLGQENRSVSGLVTVVVPAGSPVAHPALQLEAVVSATGNAAGFASPSPTIDLTPFYALRGGATATLGTTGPFNVSLPFYLYNPGNAVESVTLSVADSVRLAGIGWQANFSSGSTPVGRSISLDAGTNASYDVVLQSNSSDALPPGTVSIVATVENASGAVHADFTLKVPRVAVTLGSNGGISVTGPNLGSPPAYPDWLVWILVFVPALAFVVFAIGWRWYRTRRWSRR